MNVLLGVTGSVAATLTHKMCEALVAAGHAVKVAHTKAASHFLNPDELRGIPGVEAVHCDSEDYTYYTATGRVLHIDLRNWAEAFLIAPASANTLSKMRMGLCDSLVTDIYMAWDRSQPVYIAPAMNTMMWENIPGLPTFGTYIYPQSKKLACGDTGIGAMADIDTIVSAVKALPPLPPLRKSVLHVPVGTHPGAFGYARFNYMHSGVDLYTNDGEEVLPMESGVVVSKGQFTGPALGHTWWEDTWYVAVQGKHHTLVYGELGQDGMPEVGENVYACLRDNPIGYVKRVLLKGKERPDIPGHSTSMLHVEMYENGATQPADWREKDAVPKGLLNPTEYLLSIPNAVSMEG